MSTAAAAHSASAGVELSILGRPFLAPLAGDAQVSLAQLVPTAMAMADHLVSAAAAKVRQGGGCVACHKGCSACCNYVVSLTAPEALFLWEQLGRLPAGRRNAFYERYLQSAKALLAWRPPSEFESSPDPVAISQWYAGLHLGCPFLDGGECSIYEIRPLVCREHLSLCAASCSTKHGDAPDDHVVKLPLSLAEAMSQLASEIEPRWPAAIALPVALVWASDPAVHNHQSRRSARALLARLSDLAKHDAQAA